MSGDQGTPRDPAPSGDILPAEAPDLRLREPEPPSLASPRVRRIDTELLARAVTDEAARWERAPRSEWEALLREAGVLDLLEAEATARTGPELREPLETIRCALAAEPAERPEALPAEPPPVPFPTALGLALAGIAGALGPTWLGGLVALGLGAWVVATLWLQGDARPRPAAGRPAGRRLVGAVRDLAGHTWLDAVGELVVESTPHEAYLARRLTDLTLAREQLDRRTADLQALRVQLAETNVAMGLDAEDAETRRVADEIGKLRTRAEQIERLAATVGERLADYRAQVEHLRAIARRRALSNRVASLVDDPAQEAATPEVAAIEVDVSDLEARIKALRLDIRDADADLRAVLEVAGLR